jgi:DNA helicase-2/ATP-dependent DNA helicase PcrA
LTSENQSAYQEELQQLENIAAEIDRQLQYSQDTPRYNGHDFTEQALENVRETNRSSLAIATNEPYFGRLDFQEEDKKQATPLYIGKVGVANDATGELLVIDWRAPVASLFYSFTGGDESSTYESPEGTIEGLVYLKRNLVIRKKILQRVVDTYVKGRDNHSVGDEFLLYRLGENKDNRLRDIVSTIQAEQDRIIRSTKNTPLIIQGVAGSGKTTVALHRLAYLLYQYRENIRAEKMIIFAPTTMFLDYISNVLPELGVGGIQQTTFSEWVLDLLDSEVTLTDPANKLEQWFSLGASRPELNDQVSGRFKGSIRFLHYIEDCLNRYEAAFVPEKDFEAWEDVILPAQTIKDWFTIEYKHYPLSKRRERVIARIKRWVEIERNKIPEEHLKKDLKKKANQRLRSYLKACPDYTPFSFYKLLFKKTKRPEFLSDDLLTFIPPDVIDSSNRLFRSKEVEQEDLAPLLYIRNKLQGIERNQYFDHVVIDEAQDFSPFQLALVKEQTRGNSFTILGDLSQGIHAYQGILHWKEFMDLFEDNEATYYQLDRSYRSTQEIIYFANEVISSVDQPVVLANPVFRSGEKVKVAQFSAEERISTMIKVVAHLQAGDADTIAVVGRTEEECRELHEALEEAGLLATFIHSKQRKYGGGLSVLPIYLTKGLEFDAVLLVDVDATHYEQTAQDSKLLYVGCTRALHDLWLLYSGEPSPLIKNMDEELYTTKLGIEDSE